MPNDEVGSIHTTKVHAYRQDGSEIKQVEPAKTEYNILLKFTDGTVINSDITEDQITQGFRLIRNGSNYDLVVSVTSESAKGIITKPGTKHICYCLTPTRYLWSGYDTYFSDKTLKYEYYKAL